MKINANKWNEWIEFELKCSWLRDLEVIGSYWSDCEIFLKWLWVNCEWYVINAR